MNPPPSLPKKRHSFRSLLCAPPEGQDGLGASGPPTPQAGSRAVVGSSARRPGRSANDSHVRLRALNSSLPRATDIEFLDAQELLDELAEDQLTMSMNVGRLEEAVGQGSPDASARAAHLTLAARIADLGGLRDALATVLGAAIDPRLQRLVVPDSPLADYLRGLYAWAHSVVRALDHLAVSLRAHEPDWALYRSRVEEANNFHFDELHDVIHADLQALTIVANGGSFGADLPPIDALGRAVDRLFEQATALEERLDQRFG